MAPRPTYLDCNSTTPLDPRIKEVMDYYLNIEFGNAGSRTHVYGSMAAKAVRRSRQQIAGVIGSKENDVLFTSGATESNNLFILGLMEFAQRCGKTHFVSTQIEHKSVLEPLKALERRGFSVSYIGVDETGAIRPEEIVDAIRPDTVAVSVMHVNNETGAIQPIKELGALITALPDKPIFHVDASQGFAKETDNLDWSLVDAVSISGHKMYGPKGIGALICKNNVQRVLTPLMLGGGQERGLRAGTTPVFLAAALGSASELLAERRTQWWASCESLKKELIKQLGAVKYKTISAANCIPNTLSIFLENIDGEAAIVALQNIVAISNGSACTSTTMKPSHVISAMFPKENLADNVIRLSWHDRTDPSAFVEMSRILRSLQE